MLCNLFHYIFRLFVFLLLSNLFELFLVSYKAIKFKSFLGVHKKCILLRRWKMLTGSF